MDWPTIAIIIAGVGSAILWIHVKMRAESEQGIKQILADHDSAMAGMALNDAVTL